MNYRQLGSATLVAALLSGQVFAKPAIAGDLTVGAAYPFVLFGEPVERPHQAVYRGVQPLPDTQSNRQGRLFEVAAEDGLWSLWLALENPSIIHAITGRGQIVSFIDTETAGYGTVKPSATTPLNYQMATSHFTGTCVGGALKPDGDFTARCTESVNGEGKFEVLVYVDGETGLLALMRHQEWLDEGLQPFGFVTALSAY